MKTSSCVPQGTSVIRIITSFQKWIIFISVVLLFIGNALMASGQQVDQVTLMAYNLLNYPAASTFSADTATRNPFYRTTIAAANPDLLVVEELNSKAGDSVFLVNVMNASGAVYDTAPFIKGPDTNHGFFYKTSKFRFLSNTPIKTALRNISEYKLVHLLSGDTIRIYAVHLKASAGSANDSLRLAEVDSLRKVTNALPAGSDFIVCGDFNFYSSTDLAYQKLLQVNAGDEGHVIDPISMPGTWNNASYTIHHTQATRTRSFGGGITGGLDDRFDLILYSKAISLPGGITYVANSQIAYGNDGNHYNDSINRMPNTAVIQPVADALHYGSDHLPVIAKFDIQYGSASTSDLGVLTLVTPSTSICPNAAQSLQVQVKNYGTDTVKFATTNLQVILQATNPSSVLKTFTKIISSGSLAGGAVMNVTFDSTYNMSASGNYTLNSSTSISGDGNSSNNAMNPVIVTVNSNSSASISPAGPISLCPSASQVLIASNGTAYLWSTGATTQSITVATAGNFTVLVTNGSGCSGTSAPVVVSLASNPTAAISPAGPISLCPSSSQVLIAANGTAYLWSTGATTQSISVSSAGNYTVRITNASGCSATSSPVVVSLSSGPTATISPPGPLSICPSSSATLTSSAGSSYLWSTGATTQGIGVSTAGSYTVTVTNSSGCSAVSAPTVVSLTNTQSTGTVFTETMGGTVGMANTAISAYEISNSFDNDNFTMSGSGDVRVTSQSSYGAGFPTASALGNVFLTNTSSGKNFIISGINTSGLSGLQLSFGVWKSTSGGTGSDLSVSVSTDGTNYSPLSFSPLTTGATWFYRTATGTIPSVPGLSIRFRNDTTFTQFRIDDVVLNYVTNPPVITAGGSTTFCSGDSVTLTANSSTNYLWSTGATTQSIKVYTSGSYTVTENCLSSSPVSVTVNNCSTVTLNLKVFISGFYSGGGIMTAVVDPSGNPTVCDTIEVELASDSASLIPYQIAFTKRAALDINGNGHFDFPPDVLNHRYYIVVRHRNSLETWTKYPVLFNASTIGFDFTSP